MTDNAGAAQATVVVVYEILSVVDMAARILRLVLRFMNENNLLLSTQRGDLVHKFTAQYGSKNDKYPFLYGTKCGWFEVHGRLIDKHGSRSRHKSFFYLLNAVLSPMNSWLNRCKELQISFDETLVRSFLGAWDCDRQTYTSLTCAIFARRYLRADQ